jgi:predicted TPR repeat methyltransferase
MEGRRNKLFNHILDVVEEKIEIGKLLDIGTGCGFFLSTANYRGWKVEGIEPSHQSVEVARRENRFNVVAGTLQDYKENSQFDLITFINVLEHSSMPWLEIARAKQLLRPGGMVYLRFPNGFLHTRLFRMAHKYSLDFSLRKFLVFHIYSFTPRYIKRLLRDHGFIQTTIINSPPSEGDPHNLFRDPALASYVKKLLYAMAKWTEIMSFGRLFLGSSVEVTALKPDDSPDW